jgi:hypothetical protein
LQAKFSSNFPFYYYSTLQITIQWITATPAENFAAAKNRRADGCKNFFAVNKGFHGYITSTSAAKIADFF